MSQPPAGRDSPAWERGMARVLDGGRPVGAAFLISGRLLLTCSHVVAAIAGIPDDQALPPDFPVTLDFPLLPGCPQVEATVQFSVPVATDNSGDVAVLRLVDTPPAGAVALRVLESDQLAGHHWRAFGFPRYSGPGGSKDAGIWTRGTIEGREGTGWWQLTCDESAGFPLAGGFSGAPVWDEQFHGVIGVVVAVEGDQRRRTGYALTVESLAREWPQLRSHLLADSPFRELLPFTEQDRAVFHGRGHETHRLLELLEEQQVPVLPVLGASGVGKSSLVSAGLLAHLGNTTHLIARIPHGLRLTAEELLAWALASAGDADTSTPHWNEQWSALARQLEDEHGLRTAVEQALARHPGSSKLLLVVDQFETLLADAPETARKLDTMLGVLTARRSDGSRPAQAVVVARIDFLSQIEQLPVLRAAWEATHVVVAPMTRDQLHAALTLPLEEHAGVRYADGLVEQLLRDTPSGAAALPMLEYTLSQLWQRQEYGVLTAVSYQELGGVEGALVNNAERTLWEWADESEREALERIFIQLVRPGEQVDAGERGPDTLRVADRAQFSEHDWSLIHRLASTRLLVVTRRPNGLDTVELAHQALMERWPRLRGWLEDNRPFRSWQEDLRRTMRTWREQGRPPGLTLDRPRLKEAEHWLGTRADQIPAEEADFVRHSGLLRAHERRRRALRFAALCMALVVASVAAVVAVRQSQNSSAQQRANLARKLVSEAAELDAAQPDLAKQLRIAAFRLAPTRDTYNALSAALPLPGTITAPEATSLSAGGGLLAIAGGRTARLWSFADHAFLAAPAVEGTSTAVALTADGSLLAVGSGNGTIGLWDVTHSDRPQRLAEANGPPGPVRGLALSQDGRTLAAIGWDLNVRAWRLIDRARPWLLPLPDADTGQASGVAVSPDGRTVAAADLARGVRLWDLADPQHPLGPVGAQPSKTVRAVAFAPDGRSLAAAGDGGTVHLWDVSDPHGLTAPRVLDKKGGAAAAVAFSPNGRTLAVTQATPEFSDTTLWDFTTPGHPVELPALGSGSGALAFTPDGRTLATLGRSDHRTLSAADRVELWDIGGGAVRSALATVTNPAWPQLKLTPAAAVSEDGRLLAAGTHDGAFLWDLSDPREPRPAAQLETARGSGTEVNAMVTVALHGHMLAIGRSKAAKEGDDVIATVSLWDVADPRNPSAISSTGLGRTTSWSVVEVAFSPDGRMLTAALNSNELRLLDVTDPAHPAVRGAVPTNGRGTPVTSFDASNTVLSVSEGASLDNADGDSQLWDIGNPDHPTALPTLTARLGRVTATALSPRQRLLAVSGADGVLTLWDIRQLGAPKRLGTASGATGPLRSLRFSPDGTALAGMDDGGGVHLWDVSSPEHATATADFLPLDRDIDNQAVLTALRADGGRFLLAAGSPGTIAVRDTAPEALLQRLCAASGVPLDASTWKQYLPDIDHQDPCGRAR
ncbi:trypsin-like peptidase domain-containing protein [Kitasatospora sp. NPDC093102]|uniref:nSTAND1 domain-containing NTPase n=1 Tax=Kitasatospora sp. NPDC093102 TaxID=3155069 RepID=UPI003435E370